MEITFIYLLWFTSIVFTICSFIDKWRYTLIFPIFAFIFWTATAMSMVQVDYVGFGSTNVITYNHELNDWYGDRQLLWLCHGVGIIMLIWGFYNVLYVAKDQVDAALDANPRQWR